MGPLKRVRGLALVAVVLLRVLPVVQLVVASAHEQQALTMMRSSSLSTR